MTALFIFLGIVVFGILFFIGIYNGLVRSRNQYKNAYAQIDVQLKRRNDLIPNLVETAKGYIKHERETLEAVIAARNIAVSAAHRASQVPGDPTAMKNLMSAETQLTGVLGRLMAVAESYPELKANQNMMQLSEELTSTENKISFARQAYNDSVTYYNNNREQFPNVLIAPMCGFMPAQLLEATESTEERRAPKVSFSS